MKLLKKLTLRERTHLWEWHELQPTPALLKNLLTGTLQFLWCNFPRRSESLATKLASQLLKILKEINSKDIIDMCSGSGGPYPVISEILEKEDIKVTLSDLYPRTKEWEQLSKKRANLSYISEPVDATKFPRDLMPKECLRTFLGSFHHFNPELAQSLVQDAIDCKHTIVIVDGERKFLSMILGTFTAVLCSIFLAPLMGPPGTVFYRLFLTLIVPLFTLMYFWDTVVSYLRFYRKEELMQIAQKCKGSDKYKWESSRMMLNPSVPFGMHVFVGKPC